MGKLLLYNGKTITKASPIFSIITELSKIITNPLSQTNISPKIQRFLNILPSSTHFKYTSRNTQKTSIFQHNFELHSKFPKYHPISRLITPTQITQNKKNPLKIKDSYYFPAYPDRILSNAILLNHNLIYLVA